MARVDADAGRVITLSPRESYRAFDAEVRRRLGMDARTFMEQWEAGKIDPEQKGVAFLTTFIASFARPDKCDEPANR